MLRRLLIVDSDAERCRQLAAAFPAAEFLVRSEQAAPSALECVVQWRPECLILAADLPPTSGLDVCRRVKTSRESGRIPVLMTSAERGQHLVNRGLKEGADDFLHVPCHPTELLWRVRGLLRRYEAPPPPAKALRLGPVEIDAEQGLATLDGRELALTRKELLLLEVFLRHPKRVLTRRFLLENVWGYDTSVRTRVVDLLVFQLRRKLGRWGSGLQTRRGFGYCLQWTSKKP
jgi:DNA-binding response OmpR family regulator